MLPAHLYVHVPFCLRKCGYCDFVSYPLVQAGGGAVDRYLGALLKEAEWYAERLAPAPLTTLYVGGGTPTILSRTQLATLLMGLRRVFGPWPAGLEATCEANPGTVDAAKLTVLRDGGVNRLSIGVQSFDDELLSRAGRLARAAQAHSTVSAAREAGFTNLSLDLISGLPGQTRQGFQEDLQRAVDLGPEHLSVYSLTLEPGTPLASAVASGEVVLPSEEAEAEMFALAGEFLARAGYRRYEISNFARPGFEARHNLGYWRNEDYLALGVSASGHHGRVRYRNASSLSDYLRLLSGAGEVQVTSTLDGGAGAGEWPLSPAALEQERLSEREAMGETAFLALRLLDEGLERAEFRRRFRRDPLTVWGEEIRRLSRDGLLSVTPERVRLSARGLPVANLVFSAFV